MTFSAKTNHFEPPAQQYAHESHLCPGNKLAELRPIIAVELVEFGARKLKVYEYILRNHQRIRLPYSVHSSPNIYPIHSTDHRMLLC